MSRAYYNEIDPKAAAVLRELIARGLIAPGDVDERSITEIKPHELRGYTQCHFFAGAGIWSLAFRRGGIPDGRPAGSGSCPCQPFSAAGKGLGFDDPRHLWPAWFALIAGCRADGQPWTELLFGEQASTAGAWLDLVSADLESHGYAFGAVDIPAAGFGGFHIRQRFYWVADAYDPERWADLAPRHDRDRPPTGRIESYGEPRDSRLANADATSTSDVARTRTVSITTG
jgi:DNA (cytosine-5)-methyltransferase 1